MRRFQIPKKFILYAKPITIEYDPALFSRSGDLGRADYNYGKIILQSRTESVPFSEEGFEQYFFHELVHHLLFEAGEEDIDPPLYQREELVDRISKLLHQFFVTSEF